MPYVSYGKLQSTSLMTFHGPAMLEKKREKMEVDKMHPTLRNKRKGNQKSVQCKFSLLLSML